MPEAGSYNLYGLVRAGGIEIGKSDSFFVSVDDGDEMTWDTKTGPSLAWDPVLARGEQGPRAFELAAGEHSIRLGHREPDAEWSRWLLVPAGADAPLDPDAAPEGSIALSVGDATMGEPAFAVLEPGEVDGSEATLDVLMASAAGGEVDTQWFETSREGAHPKLLYTVRADDPHFVAVLVPRAAGVARPEVQAPAEGHGVEVSWDGVVDRIEFGPGMRFSRTVDGDTTEREYGASE